MPHEITTGGTILDGEPWTSLWTSSDQRCTDNTKEIEIMKEYSRKISPIFDVKPPPTASAKWDSQRVPKRLQNIIAEYLCLSPQQFVNTSAAQEIKALEKAYMGMMEKFLFKMREFLLSVKDMRFELKKTLHEFRVISRSAACVTVASSVTNVAILMFAAAQRIFHFSWHPKIHIVRTVVGALCFTTSLLTLSYMKRTTSEITREVRREGRILQDLIAAHRRGDWIDSEVLKLFPHKINLNFFDRKAFEDSSYFESKRLWRTHLYSAIILSNIQKNPKLLTDDEFLARAKLFVESPTAEIWWNRIKMKNLLEEIRKKGNEMSAKKVLSGHEDFIHRTALYMYPVLIPWLVNSWNSDEMVFICNSLAGILASLDLGSDDTEEFEKLREVSQCFEKYIKELRRTLEILDSCDD